VNFRTVLPQTATIMNQAYDHPDQQFSPACERNKVPILEQLISRLAAVHSVLEIGSGTGQHAAYFSLHLPQLRWQTSDRIENHASIRAWIEQSGCSNALMPVDLDVAQSNWPAEQFDAVFTANTCHIMSWPEVEKMFQGTSQVLNDNGHFFVYGPFNYAGQFTSHSNQLFDASLKSQAAHRGIRDLQEILPLAQKNQLLLSDDIDMPANNRLLLFTKKINENFTEQNSL